eukprot:CAMPEP_0170548438 /NCGR_PEP_ID=MMETSP0211-20121228/6772_1 /TAXON_ID=311385 /ORGANISM="Pseudokeronopsis sp., Strain OXSARD2" /LENGTH=134 /DNA_ID=CAMNT_0010854011 /DNA_START=517 /DNA_END=917 /DNA_ORIENTATION=+
MNQSSINNISNNQMEDLEDKNDYYKKQIKKLHRLLKEVIEDYSLPESLIDRIQELVDVNEPDLEEFKNINSEFDPINSETINSPDLEQPKIENLINEVEYGSFQGIPNDLMTQSHYKVKEKIPGLNLSFAKPKG